MFTHDAPGAPAKPGKKCGNKASITYEIKNRLPDKEGNPYPTRNQCYITCTKTANSNQEHTNLILKKVILPELGMDMATETSPEKIGLIWDEFRGHSAGIVKEYCLSLNFFHPEIIPGGLTPVAQPLDKVINKVFKGHFRDLYDLYILTAPIGKTGNPQAPSRQLLATWVVKAWDLIPEELVRKSWTACGYKSEKDLSCSNEATMVVFTDKDVGTMVEEICGEAVRSNFEDVECGQDPMHPSDEECSSDEDVGSSDDEVEEFYADPAPPARARVQDVERVEVVVDPTPPARAQVQDNRCAAGSLCGMKTTPLLRGGHVCLNCHEKVHGSLCGILWDERGDACKVRLEDLSEQGRTNTNIVGALICFGCMGI